MQNTEENLIAAAIVENKSYYLEKFSQYQKQGVPLASWNTSGFIFGFFWFLYRKIWGMTVPLLGLFFLTEFLLDAEYVYELRITFGVVSAVVGGLFGNQLYFYWIKMLIWQGKHNGKAGDELEIFLRREGGTISNQRVTDFLQK